MFTVVVDPLFVVVVVFTTVVVDALTEAGTVVDSDEFEVDEAFAFVEVLDEAEALVSEEALAPVDVLAFELSEEASGVYDSSEDV